MENKHLVIENGIVKGLGDGYDGTAITVPSGVVAIGRRAFMDSGITEITLPDGVTEIGNDAFSRCEKLVRVRLPQTLRKIRWGAFYKCSSLVEIDVPDSVEVIENSAFADCSKLEHFVLPSGMTRINCDLFYHCSALKTVYIPRSATCAFDDAFRGSDNVEIYMEGEPTAKYAGRDEHIRTMAYNGDCVTETIEHRWNPLGRPVHTNVSRAEYERIVALYKK